MSALSLRDPLKRILARCIVQTDCAAEAYHRLGVACLHQNFTIEEAQVVSKLIEMAKRDESILG